MEDTMTPQERVEFQKGIRPGRRFVYRADIKFPGQEPISITRLFEVHSFEGGRVRYWNIHSAQEREVQGFWIRAVDFPEIFTAWLAEEKPAAEEPVAPAEPPPLEVKTLQRRTWACPKCFQICVANTFAKVGETIACPGCKVRYVIRSIRWDDEWAGTVFAIEPEPVESPAEVPA